MRLFRNSVGAYRNNQGQFVRYGLGPGTSDLIGWRTTVVSPDMVGKRVAIFVAIEVKDPAGKTNQERLKNQKQFVKIVREHGGIAGFALSVDSALDLLNQPR